MSELTELDERFVFGLKEWIQAQINYAMQEIEKAKSGGGPPPSDPVP